MRIEKNNPLRKRPKFGRVNLKEPGVFTAVSTHTSQGNHDDIMSGTTAQSVIDLSEDIESEARTKGHREVELKQTIAVPSDDLLVQVVARKRSWTPKQIVEVIEL